MNATEADTRRSHAPFRVLLVDDDQAFRASLRAFLDASSEFEIVGEAGNGNAAITLVDRLTPDVVLMDAYMPATNGFESCKTIRHTFPSLPVVIVTGAAPDEDRNRAQLAGATAWVTKIDLDQIGVPPFWWTPERLVGIVRLGRKDARPCHGDRTFTSRTRRSSGVKLLSCTSGRAGR